MQARTASVPVAPGPLSRVRWTRPGGGPTLWLELPRTIELPALEAHLARRGVHVSNASAAFLGDTHLHGFRVAYAFLSESEMRTALTILADALQRSVPSKIGETLTRRRASELNPGAANGNRLRAVARSEIHKRCGWSRP